MVQKRRHVSVEDELAADIPGKLFVDEHDSPVAFFLHKSIKSQFQRNNLILGIEVGPVFMIGGYVELIH